ncbi:unnamed protein product [Hydatigera taeniaeformis]|uniref:ABC transporter ATP-binding protein n=1 Tax=Hydatigena taeniaeformis TaxID=6205 RepID=A0A0R3WZ22_HYDTA|nr:unnamed protein product [Hydatigera taeniaeformis]
MLIVCLAYRGIYESYDFGAADVNVCGVDSVLRVSGT